MTADDILASARDLTSFGRYTEARDAIVSGLAGLIAAGEYVEANCLLAGLSLGDMSRADFVAVLDATRAAKDRLPERETFYAQDVTRVTALCGRRVARAMLGPLR